MLFTELLLHDLLSQLPYSTQDHQPMCGTAHSELGPPTSIISQENARQICLLANLIETLAQLRFPLPKRLMSTWHKINHDNAC